MSDPEKKVFNIVELVAEGGDCALDQICRFGHRVEGHAVYCHNDQWADSPRKCKRTWYSGGSVRDEDCPGFAPRADPSVECTPPPAWTLPKQEEPEISTALATFRRLYAEMKAEPGHGKKWKVRWNEMEREVKRLRAIPISGAPPYAWVTLHMLTFGREHTMGGLASMLMMGNASDEIVGLTLEECEERDRYLGHLGKDEHYPPPLTDEEGAAMMKAFEAFSKHTKVYDLLSGASPNE